MTEVILEKLHIHRHATDSPKVSGDIRDTHSLSADTKTTHSIKLPVDPKEDRKLVRKLDRHVLPMITILYMLAFVDRINIGNARIQGLENDLGMVGNDYNVALFVFFIPYILFEVPSNLLLKKIKPSSWLSFIMFAWGELTLRPSMRLQLNPDIGVVTVCQGVVRSYAGLVVCRFFLGLFEAGFVPGRFRAFAPQDKTDATGCFYLISMYYKRYELQWRFNLFFCGSIISGAWAGVSRQSLKLGKHEG